ncbi:hypothetical protein RJ639_009185 [Escallonia herrerae]|uniref:Uncharacterized protein n=1 Tax=Escallonia herrerae TaxID=1293975 RepID=A0AA88VP30_9ASTE|nr:hypothetical protein RJ639_009185 [Escallonia herrerae]
MDVQEVILDKEVLEESKEMNVGFGNGLCGVSWNQQPVRTEISEAAIELGAETEEGYLVIIKCYIHEIILCLPIPAVRKAMSAERK